MLPNEIGPISNLKKFLNTTNRTHGGKYKSFFFINVMHLEYLSFECIKNVKSSN